MALTAAEGAEQTHLTLSGFPVELPACTNFFQAVQIAGLNVVTLWMWRATF